MPRPYRGQKEPKLEDRFHQAGANLHSSVGSWENEGDVAATLMEVYNGQEYDAFDPDDAH